MPRGGGRFWPIYIQAGEASSARAAHLGPLRSTSVHPHCRCVSFLRMHRGPTVHAIGATALLRPLSNTHGSRLVAARPAHELKTQGQRPTDPPCPCTIQIFSRAWSTSPRALLPCTWDHFGRAWPTPGVPRGDITGGIMPEMSRVTDIQRAPFRPVFRWVELEVSFRPISRTSLDRFAFRTAYIFIRLYFSHATRAPR